MLSLIPAELWIALAGIGSAVLAFLFGTFKGAKGEKDKQAERNAEAAKRVKDKHAEIQNEDRDAIVERLTRK